MKSKPPWWLAAIEVMRWYGGALNFQVSAVEERDASWGVDFAPTLFYFATNSFAVGGHLGAGYSSMQGLESSRFAAIALVAGNIALSRRLSLMPTVGSGFSYSEATGSGNLSSFRTLQEKVGYFEVSFRLPTLYHPVPHFFVGLGPYVNFSADLSDRSFF